MEIIVTEWISLLLRWIHLIVGIAWIGSSFYFVWLDLSLRRRDGLPEGVAGEKQAANLAGAEKLLDELGRYYDY